MISVEKAVESATRFLKRVSEGTPISNILVEEVELSEDGHFWYITLGFTLPLDVLQSLKPVREFKTFEVWAETGEVKSMKIRVVQ